MTHPLPTLHDAKQLAKALCEKQKAAGKNMKHAAALELVAGQHGFKDWNTFHAAISGHAPDGFVVGGRVTGTYLSAPFEATVLAVKMIRPGWFQVQLDLDKPVDVVTFDSFSNMRKRINGTVGPQGMSRERTSDGRPQLQIDI